MVGAAIPFEPSTNDKEAEGLNTAGLYKKITPTSVKDRASRGAPQCRARVAGLRPRCAAAKTSRSEWLTAQGAQARASSRSSVPTPSGFMSWDVAYGAEPVLVAQRGRDRGRIYAELAPRTRTLSRRRSGSSQLMLCEGSD